MKYTRYNSMKYTRHILRNIINNTSYHHYIITNNIISIIYKIYNKTC